MPPKMYPDEQEYANLRERRQAFMGAADQLFEREEAVIRECLRKEDRTRRKANELREALAENERLREMIDTGNRAFDRLRQELQQANERVDLLQQQLVVSQAQIDELLAGEEPLPQVPPPIDVEEYDIGDSEVERDEADYDADNDDRMSTAAARSSVGGTH